MQLTRGPALGEWRPQRLSRRYQRSAANERRLRERAVAQKHQLDVQNTKLTASATQLERSNKDLRNQTAIAQQQTSFGGKVVPGTVCAIGQVGSSC